MEQPKVVTIFKDVMVQDFVIRMKEEFMPSEGTAPVAEDYFYMMLAPKSEKLNKFYLQIIEGKIYMRNTADSPLLAYIDIHYARLKLLKTVEIAGKTLNGIRFIKNKNYEEIYHQDSLVIQAWYNLLKRYCVMSKFREIYLIKNVIGKGNFAKVYITTRAEDSKDFAVKIFDKQLILQDEFERVSIESNDRNACCTN